MYVCMGMKMKKKGIKMTALSVEIVCADRNVIYLVGSPRQPPLNSKNVHAARDSHNFKREWTKYQIKNQSIELKIWKIRYCMCMYVSIDMRYDE